MRHSLLGLIALSLVVTAGAAQAQSGIAQLEAGYGGAGKTVSNNFNPSTRDANNNRVILNGLIQDGQGGSQVNLSGSASSTTSGANYFRSGADNFSSGAITGSATAIGNQINVNVSGSWNTVVLDSTQINNAPVSSTVTIAGKTASSGQ
jgi:holdfast attachment protein HfaA